MADWYELHPINPQRRFLAMAAERVAQGGVLAYPTDSSYALGCRIGDKDAAERIRNIRQFDRHHLFTLVCRDLSEIATYARVDNQQYRLLKTLTPGPYTFVLEATRELPRRLAHEKRKTIGLRVPSHPVPLALLELLGGPLVSTTLWLPDADEPVGDIADVREEIEPLVDVVLDGGSCGIEPTTIIDLTGESPVLVRKGRGDVSAIGLDD
jgi:tRNA threonylcarbamoyl adenosine modification protein (Sua5/YciO/YrdC/YwlC family)